MSALAWLAIPVVALLLAMLWVMWASRERPRADTHDTVEEHERFKRAFESARFTSGRAGAEVDAATDADRATGGDTTRDERQAGRRSDGAR